MVSSVAESATGELTLINRSGQKILWYLIIIDFTQGEANEHFSIPLFNVNLSGETPIDFRYMSWVKAHGNPWGNPLIPGKETQISFSSPEALATCPTGAKLSVVKLKYENGTVFDYESPALNLTPMLLAAPLRDLQGLVKRNPTSVAGSLHVNVEGHVDMIYGLTDSDSEMSSFLDDLVKDWIFAPAVIAGTTTDGRLDFIFSIGDLPPEWNQLKFRALSKRKSWVIPIHILPPSNTHPDIRKTWSVAIGGRIAASGLK
jgi:hypothetical protein